MALVAAAVAAVAAPAAAHDPAAAVLRHVGFDQRPGEQVPADLALRDEQGRTVTLGTFLGRAPVVLTLNDYGCRNLCPLALNGLAETLAGLPLAIDGDYVVVTVSIDSRDTPAAAARARGAVVGRFLRPGVAWHFLVADQATVDRLARAVGFRYAYDAAADQFAHPTGIVVLTPDGRVARYLFGLDVPARDLRLALVEAAGGRIGSVADRLLLICYRYDAVQGRYTPLVLGAVRAGGALTLLGVAALLAALVRGHGPGRRAPRTRLDRR